MIKLISSFFGLQIKKQNNKTICVDFDGVIHTYTSRWAGPKIIKDPPVKGAIKWLTEMTEHFDVCIYSSRSKMLGGRKAMKSYLLRNGLPLDILAKIRFPVLKPAAYLFIDDRAFCFRGMFPTVDYINTFTPWNREEDRL